MTNIQGTAATGYAPITAPSVRDDIAQRADTVERLINSDGVFSYATASEVARAANVIFSGDARTADGVIDELARRGTLDDFAAEVMDGNVVGGGLSVTNRQRLMANFAKNLDGDSLAKVSDAFAATHARSGGHESVAELGQAIGTHATAGAKLDYLAAQAPKTTDKPFFTTTGIGSTVTTKSDAEALAAAHVVGSLKDNPRAAETAFRTLAGTEGATEAVVRASAQQRTMTAHAGMNAVMTPLSDTRVYTDVMAAAAAIRSDASYPTARTDGDGLKAGVVAAGMAVHAERDGMLGTSASQAALLTGVESVIASDADGVIGHMANNADHLGGTTLASYAKAQIEAGNEGVLGEHLAAVQLGDDGRGNLADRFDAPTAVPNGRAGAETYPHAKAAGYLMGSIYAGSQSITSDQAEQAKIATSIAKSGLSVIDKLGGKAGGGAAGIALSVSKEWVGYGIEAMMVTESTGRFDAFYKGGIPQDANGNQAVSDEAYGAYRDKFLEVQEQARP